MVAVLGLVCMRRCFIAFILGLVFWLPAWAWHSNGHRIVAQIAYDNLNANAKDKIGGILHATRSSKFINFVASASWSDEIKLQGVRNYDHWHYIDIPYTLGGIKGQAPEQENAVWAIDKCIDILQNPSLKSADKLFYLRMLIHLIGDIHQPLHTINRYSSLTPKGDAGGNLFFVRGKDNHIQNLHALWDSGAELFDNKYHDNALNARQVKKIADKFQHQYSMKDYLKQNPPTLPLDWAKEGYRIAIIQVYDLPKGKKPSSKYIKKAQATIQKRLTIAGYRLALVLNQIFTSDKA